MQQLIDLHSMLVQLDVRDHHLCALPLTRPMCPHPNPKPEQVRDDHLCEERGLRATQELLREVQGQG